MHVRKLVLGVFLGVAMTAGARAAGEVDHSKMDHAAMGHGPPAAADGPWAYTSRKNPAPYTTNRWEMVPVPQYGHMFVSTERLSPELRCAALRENPGVMVDRATRKRCGMPEQPSSSSASTEQAEMDHKVMGR